ncbi:retron St85 family RNA-directed DNA polymerase [Ciceribacter selenitireducens]|uniref:retron St85 family RNA-directed DNA polymerase n=1 Tax=Ciceribacter selenitireducens TaxID=448181 RepID=UPI00146FBE0F|nr:retron St85 family RNA-directed DNA polymerase [Ciceribacter selenitireducens]
MEQILWAEQDGFSEEQAMHFRNLGLPPIPTVGSLPLFLGISPKTIFSIRGKPRKHYRSFPIRKKDGTPRYIDTPRTYLKVIQWWILDNILNHVQIADNVFGFVSGRSAVQNAEFHLGAAHMLNIDIEQFFPSITIDQIRAIYGSLGYGAEVANLLAELCCLDDRVPQGAPTSPALANLVLRDLDKELSRLALQTGHKYSRYADDLTFSSSHRIETEFLDAVQTAVEQEGFNLKPGKTRFSGLGGRMEVTGVVINEKTQPSRVWRRRTRATLHKLGNSPRLTRKNVSYLLGIKGMAKQFQNSPQMQRFSLDVEQLLEAKSQTVIGKGTRPILPNRLTIRQAETLAALAPRRTNMEIAMRLETTEAAVKKRLQEAFKKIGVVDRTEALNWATHNL